MPCLAVGDHRAIVGIERREQGRGAVALVVMGHACAQTSFHRQTRLGSVQRLNLALLVAAQRGLVDLMLALVETWERSTGSNRIELAERSRIWRVNIDDGRLRTRAMERYLSVSKLPHNPRWCDVMRSAYFVLAAMQDGTSGEGGPAAPDGCSAGLYAGPCVEMTHPDASLRR